MHTQRSSYGGRLTPSFPKGTYIQFRKNNQNKGILKFTHLNRGPLKLTSHNEVEKNLINFEYWSSFKGNRLVTFHSCVSYFHEHLARQIERHISKNPDVNSPFLRHRLSTECALDVGASSREWRSRATPTTDCEAPWRMVSEYVHRDKKNLTLKRSPVVFEIWIGRRMYTRDWREQSGVAEQSEADDRLRSAMEDGFQSGSIHRKYGKHYYKLSINDNL